MLKPNNLFASIIDPEAAAAAACPAIRDAIVMTIVSNTASTQRVPSDGLEGLLEMAKEFSASNFILVQRGTNVKEFKFEAEDGIKNMRLLTGLLQELKDAEVCDANSITHFDNAFTGFCWNEKIGGNSRFCGCYHIVEEVAE